MRFVTFAAAGILLSACFPPGAPQGATTSRLMASPGSGTLDPSFGTGGQATASIGFGYGLAVQSDGKIVTLASNGGDEGVPRSFTLARFLQDGSLDASFGRQGRIEINFGQGYAVAVRPNDKIVVAGQVLGDIAVSQFEPDGKRDQPFGKAGRARFAAPHYQSPSSIAIQPNGKIVVGGEDDVNGTAEFEVLRALRHGRIDRSFGKSGTAITDFGGQSNLLASLALGPRGKIVAAGMTDRPRISRTAFAIAEYNASGALRRSFGRNGKIVSDITSGRDFAIAASVDGGGQLYVGGYAHSPDSGNDFALERYTSGGRLDRSFGSSGIVTTDFGSNDRVYAVSPWPHGEVLVAGATKTSTGGDDFALALYSHDGSLDSGFGLMGKTTTDFNGRQDWALDIPPEKNGTFIAGGRSGGNDFALARYFANP